MEERLSLPAKLALLALTGVVGLSLYAAAEPACLAGPFGQVDPALFPVWLGSVSETQSMLSLGSQLPTLGGLALAYFAAGLYCGLKLMRSEPDDALRFHVLALIIALPLSFWQIKLLPYATFLPVPLLAVGLARPPQAAKAPPSRRRTVADASRNACCRRHRRLADGAHVWAVGDAHEGSSEAGAGLPVDSRHLCAGAAFPRPRSR